MWNIDMTEDGIYAIFKPYQVQLIAWILGLPKETEFQSRQAFDYLNERLEMNISRASVINFLQKLDGWGLISSTQGTGKGGKRPVYQRSWSQQKMGSEILYDTIRKLHEALPESDFIKEVWDYVNKKRFSS